MPGRTKEKAYEIRVKDYEMLIKYTDHCNELKNKNTGLQDKIVVTVSTALFGIIIGAIDIKNAEIHV